MPVDSEGAPLLPHRYRPYGVRLAGALFGGMLLVIAVVVWFAFPPDVRARFTFFQRSTLVFLALLAFTSGYALVRSRLDVEPDRVVLVNGYRKRVFDWNEIIAISLPRGAPWAGFDLADGTSVAVMGIQGSDGDRARRAVRQVRTLLAQQTDTSPDD